MNGKSLKILAALLLSIVASTSGIDAQTFNLKNKSIDLRPQIQQMGLSVRDQFSRPTCTLFASTFLIEFQTAKEKKLNNLDFSEEYLNAMADRSTGSNYDGAFFADAVEGYEEFGIVSQTQAPYKAAFDAKYLFGSDKTTLDLLEDGKKARFLEGEVYISPNAANKKPGLTDEQFLTLLKTLDSGTPVAVGHSGGSAADTTYVDIGGGNTAMSDYDFAKSTYAHSVPLVGYVANEKYPGGGYFIFRNSAGADWGDDGYGYMTFNYAKKFSYDLLVIKKSPPNLAVDLKLYEKRFLLREDVLRPLGATRARISLPFIDGNGLRALDSRVKRRR